DKANAPDAQKRMGPQGFGPPWAQPGKKDDDYARWMELAKQLYDKFQQEQPGAKGKSDPGPAKGKMGMGEMGFWKGKGKAEPAATGGKKDDDYARWMELARKLYDQFQKDKAKAEAPKKEFAKKEMGKKEFAKKEAGKSPWVEQSKKQPEPRPWA